MHLGLLLEYCKEARAGDAAMVAGASRNTAQTTFRKFDRRVTAIVQRMHRLGGIAVATEALTLRDLEFLRKHPGKRSSAEAVSRRIFFHGLNVAERVSHLIEPDLKEAIGFCLGRLPAALRKSWRTPSSILERRRHLTDREWIAYLGQAFRKQIRKS